MANRGDINRLCANLTQMGVEIKPEELQNLSRATAFRVMSDFTVAAFLASPGALNQQLAIALETCNPSSTATPLIQNKCILWSEAFSLLSKGGSTVFEFTDLLRPEAKKFSNLLQQMLKYLFYSANVYNAVSEECNSLGEVAEEVERQRVLLDHDKDELRILEQKTAHLNEAKIAEELNIAVGQRDEVRHKAMMLQNEYAELKTTLEKEQKQLSDEEETLSNAEHQLAELRDLVVSDPESQMSAFEQLRKDLAAEAVLLANTEAKLAEVNSELKLLEDEEDRARKILKASQDIGNAAAEFHQNTELMQGRIADNQRSLVDFESDLERLQKNVESRNRQIEIMKEQERMKSETIQALEKKESVRQELLANTTKRKAPLAARLTKMKQELNEYISWTEDTKASALLDTSTKYEELRERWRSHLEQVKIFEAECLKTEERLKLSHAELLKLVDVFRSLQ